MNTPEQKALKSARSRRLKKICLALPSLAALALASVAEAQTVSWDGSESDDWNDPDNWDTGALPSAGDDIVMDADPGALLQTGTHLGANFTLGAIEWGTLDITGAGTSLTLSGDAVIGDQWVGQLHISDGAQMRAGSVVAAFAHPSAGIILVTGEGSLLEAPSMTIGQSDWGFLDAHDGASIVTDDLVMGANSNAMGRVLIEGDGTTLTADHIQVSAASLGMYGGTYLSIANGAHVTATTGVDITSVSGAYGALVIGQAFDTQGAGTLDTPVVSMGPGYANLIFYHTSTGYEFAPEIDGGSADSTVWVAGGETILTGQSDNFEGIVQVYSSGRLIVNGALSGDYIVSSFLGGSGTVGSVTMQNEGMLAPGNSIGTLTIDGDLIFDAGSIFEVELNPSTSDFVSVSGDLIIDGGEVRVLAAPGAYAPSTLYHLIEADDVAGAFDEVTSNSAFLDPVLIYGADYVDLQLIRNVVSFADIAQTPNQRNAASAIEAAAAGPLFDALLTSSLEDAQHAYETLADDLHAGIANQSAQEFLSFSSALNTRLVQTAEAARPFMLASNADTVSAPRGPGGAGAWFTAFSSGGEVDSDGNYAELDADRTGFVVGMDRVIRANAWVGAAFGVTDVDYDVRSVGGSGESSSYQAALYGGAQKDLYRLRGGVAYAYRTIETERIADVVGTTQRLTSDYESQGVQLFGEIGRSVEFDHAMVEPFFNASLIGQWTGGFSETGGSAALSFDDADQMILSMIGGARGAFELSAQSYLYGTLAWRHAEGDTDEAAQASFASAPGPDFSLSGAPLEADTALLEAGFRRDFGGASLMLSYEGELGEYATRNGVRLHYRLAL